MSTRALMVSHVDNAGISRLKLLPWSPGQPAPRATMSLSAASLLAIDDSIAVVPGMDAAIGDLRAVPDLDAVAVLDEAAGLAWAPSDLQDLAGDEHPACQRSLLRRVARRAADAGYDVLVGFELEFTLFRADAPTTVAHDGPGYGVRAFLRLEELHLRLLEALQSAGVPVEQISPEYGEGQLEISLAPRAPLTAVDDYLLTRTVVARTAAALGFVASFSPLPIPGHVGNGCHVHLSARRDGRPIFADAHGALDPDAGMMIAGVVDHLAEGVALLGGSTLSFERLQPNKWAGAFVCWGRENREAAVRYMPGPVWAEGAQANIEVKCVDPAANHYLAVAYLLASALDGVERRLALPAGVDGNPAAVAESDRDARGVRPFASSLGAALELYRASDFVAEVLRPMLFPMYAAVRQQDAEAFADLPVDEVADRVRFRW